MPSQSCQASSRESWIPIRRCSGLSTKNSPPNDQNACPPSDGLGLLVEQDHPPPGVGQLGGRDQPGEAGPDTIASAERVLTGAKATSPTPRGCVSLFEKEDEGLRAYPGRDQ